MTRRAGKAVLFDLDGVVLDSGFDGFQWAYETRKQKLEEMGKDVDLSGFEQLIFDVGSLEELQEVIDERGLDLQEVVEIEQAVVDRKLEMVREGEMELFSDVEPVLQQVDSSKVIISNAFQSFLDRFVEVKDLEDHFEDWMAPSISNLKNYHSLMKPETDMIEKALEKVEENDAVMVGDSEIDVEAANRAGIESVFIDRDGEEMEEADHSISSLEELPEIVARN